jgi:Domain of unknown function (DUF4136)
MRLLALALLAGIVAYAQKIEVEFDQNVDFAKYRTFSIRDGKLNSKNPSLNSDLIKRRIDGDIQKYLEAKGLTFLPEGRSDLNVHYSLGATHGVTREAYPAGWRGWGTRVVRVPHTEGTLVIDLRDSSTKALVWRGIAREDKSNASQIEGKLDDMVRKSIEKYPPKPK